MIKKMLDCEICGRTFAKEQFLKIHLSACKKKHGKKIVQETDTEVQAKKEIEYLDVVDKDELKQDELKQDELKQDEKSVSSSPEEKRVAPVQTKKKEVTFKEPDNIEKILKSVMNNYFSQLNNRINNLELKLSSAIDSIVLSNEKYTKTSFENIEKELSSLSTAFRDFCSSTPPKQNESTQTQPVFAESENKVQKDEDCCLILATNEDRLKRRLFKVCLIENWSDQQDKVRDTYHVVMERMFERVDDGEKALKQIEENFSKRRVSTNKKWYKLRDNDLEDVVELFN